MKVLLAALISAMMLSPFSVAPGFGQADIAATLGAAVARCWLPPIREGASPPVQARFTLDTTGEIVGKPEIVAPSDDPFVQTSEAAAIRALLRCAPFEETAASLGSATQIVVNFSLAGFGASTVGPQPADDDELIEITEMEGLTLRISVPNGLCYVDPQRSQTEAEYKRLMSETIPGFSALAFFLDCSTVEQLASGNEDFDLPRTHVTLTTPLASNGAYARPSNRTLAQTIALYEALFSGSGVAGSQLESELRTVEEQLETGLGIEVDSGAQDIVRTDEYAVYVSGEPQVAFGETTRQMTSIGAFTQIFDAPLTVSLYTPYDPDAVPLLIEEVARMVSELHTNSTRE
ncbi:hypothetical protein [Aliihoeflea sp. PC F10.4]